MYVLALLHACNGKNTCTYAMKWGIFYNETKSKQLRKVHKSVGIGSKANLLFTNLQCTIYVLLNNITIYKSSELARRCTLRPPGRGEFCFFNFELPPDEGPFV